MYYDNESSVRINRLEALGVLEELARIRLTIGEDIQVFLLWLGDRLLVAENNLHTDSHNVYELEFNGTRLERRSEILKNDGRLLRCWCVVDKGLAIIDANKFELLHYTLE